MKKQICVCALLLMMVTGMLCQNAAARDSYPVGLTFSGTTATCTFSTAQAGADIKATMTLWHSGTIVDSWTGQGHNYLRMSEQCGVSQGQTYTLTVSFTVNGTTMPTQSVTKTNS